MWPLNASYSARIAVFFFVMAAVGFGLVFGLARSIKARVGSVDASAMPQLYLNESARQEIDKLLPPQNENEISNPKP